MAPPRLGDPVEQRLEPPAVARLVAGSTGSKQRNSDTHRMRHMDLGRHSIGHTGRCNLLLGFRLQERRGSLAELEPLQRQGLEIAGRHTRRIRLDCHSLDDHLAGSRFRIPAAEEGLP